MPRFEVNIDSEREFDCHVHDKNSLVLQNLHNMSIRISHRRYTADGVIEDFITLHKNALIRLAAEIQSWCETGEFIKPMHEYIAVIEDMRPNPGRHYLDTLHMRFVKASDHEAAKTQAVCDWIKNPNEQRLIGVLPMPEEK